MISQAVFDDAPEYAAQFASARPFRHVVIDGFLETPACQALLDAFPSFEDRYAFNEMGHVGNKAVRTDVGGLTDIYRALDAQVRSPEFLALVSSITGIPDLLYDPDYIGGGTHDNRDGQRLDPHVDFNILPGRRWHRRLNLIIYLNPAWEESWGGCIELHSNPWSPHENQRRSFLPLFNRCVIFETNEHSWHGFETIRLPPGQADLSRKSFAIYLYTEQRPEQEKAASHGTVYVPAGMPAQLRAGEVLEASDHAELQRRFGHLLGQLKFLYDRELEFSAQIGQLQQALEEASSCMKIDLQGYARQERGAHGLWPDGWMAREMRLCFTPTVAANVLRLAMFVPRGLDRAQQMRVELGSMCRDVLANPGETIELALELDMPAGVGVPLSVRCESAWQPSAAGDGADHRHLAWHLVRAELGHSQG